MKYTRSPDFPILDFALNPSNKASGFLPAGCHFSFSHSYMEKRDGTA